MQDRVKRRELPRVKAQAPRARAVMEVNMTMVRRGEMIRFRTME